MGRTDLVAARDLLIGCYGGLLRLNSQEPEVVRLMERLEEECSRLTVGISRRALASDNLPEVEAR